MINGYVGHQISQRVKDRVRELLKEADAAIDIENSRAYAIEEKPRGGSWTSKSHRKKASQILDPFLNITLADTDIG